MEYMEYLLLENFRLFNVYSVWLMEGDIVTLS